nr:hypothetical protein [Algoriphagus sp.]
LKDKKLRQRIEEILVSLPHCRDDDSRLIANIWQRQMIEQYGEQYYSKMSARDLLTEFTKGKLSSPESIRRIRQKIQEKQILLRGQTYHQRQRHQSEVKKEIRAFYN